MYYNFYKEKRISRISRSFVKNSLAVKMFTYTLEKRMEIIKKKSYFPTYYATIEKKIMIIKKLLTEFTLSMNPANYKQANKSFSLLLSYKKKLQTLQGKINKEIYECTSLLWMEEPEDNVDSFNRDDFPFYQKRLNEGFMEVFDFLNQVLKKS